MDKQILDGLIEDIKEHDFKKNQFFMLEAEEAQALIIHFAHRNRVEANRAARNKAYYEENKARLNAAAKARYRAKKGGKNGNDSM